MKNQCNCSLGAILAGGCVSARGGECPTEPAISYYDLISANHAIVCDYASVDNWLNRKRTVDVRDLVNCYYCSGCSKYAPCTWDETGTLPVCEECERLEEK